jgi:hypothetical protein
VKIKTLYTYCEKKFGRRGKDYETKRSLRLNLSTSPDLKFYTAQKIDSTVLDPITGNFKANSFCIILDKVT